MIDIKILRDNPELVKANAIRRGCDVDIDQLVAEDQQYLELNREVEELRAERNRLSKECKNKPEARETVKLLKVSLGDKEKRLAELKAAIEAKMDWLPNFLAPDVPDGAGDQDNAELCQKGKKPEFSFTPLDHHALGEKLGIIDLARGAKVAQSGFYYWRGAGAGSQAMFFYGQQELVKRGFTLFLALHGQQQTLRHRLLPFFADQTYSVANEDLALIGTSEQTLVGYHADELLEAEQLPYCYTAYTPCFRTEAGSYGKETRGIFRVHQFHKVELIVFCLPEESEKYHQFCLECEESLLQQLGIPYRIVNVCVGDMGAPGYKKYDIEAWYPGYGGYREVTSNTNLTEFQSRRLNVRFKDKEGRRGFVHTISATGLTDRVVCAIMENFQQEDGSVIVPEVLRPYTGFDRITPAN